MSFFDILKGSLATLKANKLRTLLTMLGIIIGISSVITMWAIGNGGRDSILGDLKKVGYGKFSWLTEATTTQEPCDSSTRRVSVVGGSVIFTKKYKNLFG